METSSTKMLWQPSPERIAASNMTAFMKAVSNAENQMLSDYKSLWQWSVDHPEAFWNHVWDWCDIRADHRGERVLIDGDKMPGAQFYPDARLNFAENLLRRSDEGDAIVFWGEDKVKRRLSWQDLHVLVSRLQQFMTAQGIGPGDRVAGFVPNMPETIAAMLAAASLGAVWSSCSPDFGVQGVLDRFGQIEPKLLFCADGYNYNGKTHDSLGRVKEIVAALPSVRNVIVFPYVGEISPLSALGDKADWLEAHLAPYQPKPVAYTPMPFNSPLYIMFSSGTTGKPKCIVHGIGGTLLQHVKEHRFHANVKPGDRVFYFTTCGWMMWNWLVSALACEATVMLYDGAPSYPDPSILFNYADAEKITFFGTSAKWIDAIAKDGLKPMATHDLSTIEAIGSTGSPLVPEAFEYVYNNIKQDVNLASLSGGTDIISCFALGNPILPVWRGELQSRGLGLAVAVYDDDGKAVTAEKGELVCEKPFPCMPIAFWNDPDGSRYRAAYFERFENIWCHGDYVALTEHDGLIIFGRSDATLNPGGVRIGTAEIYRQVEKLEEVVESLVIGQDWEGDTRVILFVRLRPHGVLDEALTKKIKTHIRQNCTPRHVPAKVIAVDDIPRTKSGKIVELAVRDVVHGRAIKNQEALANPEALDLFRNLAVLGEA